MVKFIFFDISKEHVRAHQKILQNHILDSQFILEDVRKIDAKMNIDIYVSPANSYGYMDGGIDEIYSEMFPDIQKIVQTEINNVSTAKTRYGKLFLPVGSALVVPIPKSNQKYMVSAPTMDVPRDIRKTPEYVYYAMVAILKVCQSYGFSKDAVVAIPGLGTGVGNLDPEECAEQILKAYLDFNNDRICYPDGVIFNESKSYYISDKEIKK
jgi:O-acetyl-ADP-ribose deacetylase (regulator of RNase III)